MDIHISVIADIKDVFKRVRPDIDIINWSLSDHSWVFNIKKDPVKHVNSESWFNFNMESVKRFQDEYNTYLSIFDGFIVGHPNSFVLLFEKYNKPIYVINTCRYDLPFCWNKDDNMIEELRNCFKRLQEKRLLKVISNNNADNAYFRLANPTIHSQIIPSLGLYTEMKWDPTKKQTKFLLYSGHMPDHELIVKKNELVEKYSWSNLMDFKGIIHIPYEASTMSFAEQYSSGIPLFVPSRQFLRELWKSDQYKLVNYWGLAPLYLSETEDDEFWIEKADYYSIEGIYYFNSFDHLFILLETFTDSLFERRKTFLQSRYNNVINKYTNLLN